MLPVGTRVIAMSAEHLPARLRRPGRIIGRIGVVIGHNGGADAPNIVAGLSRWERLMGFWVFPDRALAAAGTADLTSLPRWIPVADYWGPNTAPDTAADTAPDSDAA